MKRPVSTVFIFKMSIPLTPFTLLQISVLSVAETVRSCSLDQCYKSLLSPATSETKRKMSTFISNIKASDGFTQHAAGFQKAFQLLRNTSSLTRHSTSKSYRRKYTFKTPQTVQFIFTRIMVCISDRHGDHLPVIWHHIP